MLGIIGTVSSRISIENNAGIIGRFSQILEAGLVIWWKRNEENLPKWSKACKDMLLLQPSSAAAERHFIELYQINKSLH